jgi:hypothetical protein
MGGPDPLAVEVARAALSVARQHGFALGGGLALVVHGVVDRPTEDVDVFTDLEGRVGRAGRLVEAALRGAGFEVTPVDDPSEFSAVIEGLDEYIIEWELRRGDRVVRLSLSCQARSRAPVAMDIGPVIDLADLLAWKVAALVGRARERDYIDVAAVLDRYSPGELLELARGVDGGIEDDDAPLVGRRLDRLPDEAFYPYRLDAADVARLRDRFAVWPR